MTKSSNRGANNRTRSAEFRRIRDGEIRRQKHNDRYHGVGRRDEPGKNPEFAIKRALSSRSVSDVTELAHKVAEKSGFGVVRGVFDGEPQLSIITKVMSRSALESCTQSFTADDLYRVLNGNGIKPRKFTVGSIGIFGNPARNTASIAVVPSDEDIISLGEEAATIFTDLGTHIDPAFYSFLPGEKRKAQIPHVSFIRIKSENSSEQGRAAQRAAYEITDQLSTLPPIELGRLSLITF